MNPIRTLAAAAARRATTSTLPRRAPAAAGYHVSSVRLAGKESKLHSEGRAQDIEREKQDALAKAKQGQGQWKEELASDSESIVKADRSEGGKSTEETIRALQEEAKKVGKS
ncbi:hypothetical protein BU24DRAFT_458454 [Aaosphaeria arxii CBS 175.79]|uniref:Uncharacterized protein n=1 Tax=Aaosphaeria arxii CBS 175.79 TaxID=1450172 RepID=A0A6A5Y0J3_9PLEO|nr:uncharacterized protein BU24DRAFT_458454 [Aaosphaeria arxii CBS 175.79]KAF2018713.1 hypothetical protein BU24DRAFT_458454 [Aaosphaeria arxii CBS 175.79]